MLCVHFSIASLSSCIRMRAPSRLFCCFICSLSSSNCDDSLSWNFRIFFFKVIHSVINTFRILHTCLTEVYPSFRHMFTTAIYKYFQCFKMDCVVFLCVEAVGLMNNMCFIYIPITCITLSSKCIPQQFYFASAQFLPFS